MSDPQPYCLRLRRYFDAYQDRETSFLMQRMLERHLEGCADCREELELLRRTIALVGGASAPEADPRLLQRVVDAVAGPRGGTPAPAGLRPDLLGLL